MSDNGHGKGKMPASADEEFLPDVNFLDDLYESSSDEDVIPAACGVTLTTKGESSKTGSTLQSPAIQAEKAPIFDPAYLNLAKLNQLHKTESPVFDPAYMNLAMLKQLHGTASHTPVLGPTRLDLAPGTFPHKALHDISLSNVKKPAAVQPYPPPFDPSCLKLTMPTSTQAPEPVVKPSYPKLAMPTATPAPIFDLSFLKMASPMPAPAPIFDPACLKLEVPGPAQEEADTEESDLPLSVRNVGMRTPKEPGRNAPAFSTDQARKQPGRSCVGDTSGIRPSTFTFEVESPWFNRVPTSEANTVHGVAANLISGHRGYVPAARQLVYEFGTEASTTEVRDRKVLPARGAVQRASSPVRSQPLGPVEPAMTLQHEQPSQQAPSTALKRVMKLANLQLSPEEAKRVQLLQQLAEAEAMVVDEEMDCTDEVAQGKRLLAAAESECDQALDLYHGAILRETSLQKSFAELEGQLETLRREGASGIRELVLMKNRVASAEEGNRLLFKSGKDNVAFFSNEIATLKAGMVAAERFGEQQRTASEEKAAAIIRRQEGLLVEKDAYVGQMDEESDRLRTAVRELEAQIGRQEVELGEQQRRTQSAESELDQTVGTDRLQLIKALQVQKEQHDLALAEAHNRNQGLKREHKHAIGAVRAQLVKALQVQKQQALCDLTSVQQRLATTRAEVVGRDQEILVLRDTVSEVKMRESWTLADEVEKCKAVTSAHEQSLLAERQDHQARGEADKRDYYRAMADAQQQLQHSLEVQDSQNNENRALLAVQQQQAETLSELGQELAASREEASRLKDAVNTQPTTEPPSDTSSENTVAAEKLTIQALTAQLEAQRSEYDRTVADLRHQLDTSTQTQVAQSRENSILLEQTQEQAKALAKVESELARSHKEVQLWKDSTTTKSNEARISSFAADKAVLDLTRLQLEKTQVELERDAALADNNNLELRVEDLLKQAKAVEDDIKARDQLLISLARSQKAVETLQSQLEWQQRDPRLSIAVQPSVIDPTNSVPNQEPEESRKESDKQPDVEACEESYEEPDVNSSEKSGNQPHVRSSKESEEQTDVVLEPENQTDVESSKEPEKQPDVGSSKESEEQTDVESSKGPEKQSDAGPSKESDEQTDVVLEPENQTDVESSKEPEKQPDVGSNKGSEEQTDVESIQESKKQPGLEFEPGNQTDVESIQEAGHPPQMEPLSLPDVDSKDSSSAEVLIQTTEVEVPTALLDEAQPETEPSQGQVVVSASSSNRSPRKEAQAEAAPKRPGVAAGHEKYDEGVWDELGRVVPSNLLPPRFGDKPVTDPTPPDEDSYLVRMSKIETPYNWYPHEHIARAPAAVDNSRRRAQKNVPSQDVPSQDLPAEAVRAKIPSTEDIPTGELPAEVVPAEEPSTEDLPAQELPAEVVLAEEPSIEDAPEEPSAEDVPAEELPAVVVPAEEASIKDVPEEPSAVVVPAEIPSIEDVPAKEPPAEELLSEVEDATTAMIGPFPRSLPRTSSILSVAHSQVSSISSLVAGPQASSPSVEGKKASSVVSALVAGPQASSSLTPSVSGMEASSVVSPSVDGHQATSVVSVPPPAQEASSPAASPSVGGPQASSVVSSSDAGKKASSVIIPSVAGPQSEAVVSPSVVGHQATSVEQDCPSPADDTPVIDSLIDLPPVDLSREVLAPREGSCLTPQVTLRWLLPWFILFAFVMLCGYNYWQVRRERAVWFDANDATRELYQMFYGQARQGLPPYHEDNPRDSTTLWFSIHRFLEYSRAFPG